MRGKEEHRADAHDDANQEERSTIGAKYVVHCSGERWTDERATHHYHVRVADNLTEVPPAVIVSGYGHYQRPMRAPYEAVQHEWQHDSEPAGCKRQQQHRQGITQHAYARQAGLIEAVTDEAAASLTDQARNGDEHEHRLR